jgi:multiple sugar transport system permease protein
LLSFLVYTCYPVLRSLYLSFTDYRFAQLGNTHTTGLQNYREALTDPRVTSGFIKAALFLLLFYFGGILIPLVIALVLDRVKNERIAGLYRVLLYIPAIIPGPLIFAMWLWIYDPSNGLMNYLLVDVLHVADQGPGWLSDPHQALLAVAIMEWWWGLGQMTVFLLVGLKAIPRELYESARIDGANELRVVRHIALPLMTPTIMTWMILKLSAFGVVVEMLVLQGAGDSLQTWGRYAWETAFTGALNVGYASAIGWLGGIAMVLMTGIIYLVFRRSLKSI